MSHDFKDILDSFASPQPGNLKLTPDSVRAIRQDAQNGRTTRDIAQDFQVALETVRSIVQKRTWKHIQD